MHQSLLFMKMVFCFIFSLAIQAAYCQIFSKLKVSTDSAFGYTNEKPLCFKIGNAGKSLDHSLSFFENLRTIDGQKLLLLKRMSVDNPNYNRTKRIYYFNKRFRSTLNRNTKRDLLDQYVFVTETTKDTIILFADIYNAGKLFIPVGLRLEQ